MEKFFSGLKGSLKSLSPFKAWYSQSNSQRHKLSLTFSVRLTGNLLLSRNISLPGATDPDMKHNIRMWKLSGKRRQLCRAHDSQGNPIYPAEKPPHLPGCLCVTQPPAAVRPVCKLSLIRRRTGHGGVWVLPLFRGQKEGKDEGGNVQLREPPYKGLDQATQHLGQGSQGWGTRFLVLMPWKWTLQWAPGSTCPLSSEEYSNNRVYYLWRVYYIQNTELISTVWNYLPPPPQLPSFEVITPRPSSLDEETEELKAYITRLRKYS